MTGKSSGDIRSKLALLQLAKELGSISRACDIMGYSRDSYYRFKRQYEKAGEQGLKNLSRKKPALKNRVSPEVESQVIEIALDYPNYGQARAAELLTARGCTISPSGVRAIWVRHNLETKKNRLLALQNALDQRKELDPESRRKAEALYELKQDQMGVECRYPGEVCVQDTFKLGEVGTLGTLYQHTFLDAYSQYAHGWISTSNDSAAASEFLLSRVAPWYRQHSLPISNLLTDKGAEFFGGKSLPYQQAIAELECNHIHMRAYNGPVVNGLGARFHTLIWNELYEPLFKAQRYEELAPIQQKLDEWLARYNQQFAVAGRYTLGKTPSETLAVSRHLIPSR
ncbi:helix-turn-helix domain-containing protein [Ferrimonas sp. YFM]|uniref:helix-turn-helix domain-containing protein n=1 Tax=Ferrimonas sp. YFM TaxID=3028878 RepID=UPI002573020B|nr:helix-turn-helix domain-containing protein [Ferrimonas sp. YFM]BDY06859.1 IS481 family transposase [Ferrimonas sp. YFM]